MAKRRKHKKTHHSRSRMGKLPTGDIKTLLGVAVGLIGGRYAKNAVTSIDPKIMGGIQVVAGALLSGQRNELIKGAGYGLFGGGALQLAQSFNLVSGMPVLYPRISGAPNSNVTPLISGYNDEMSAVPPEVSLISGVFDEYS